MLKSFISIALFWLFTGVVSCTTPPPPQPELEFLYSLNCSLAPIFTYGVGPFGEVRAIGITGGTFEGPKIKGTILDLGADWNYLDNKGVNHPDTRYSLRTDDGENIYIKTAGSGVADGKSFLRGVYETGSEKYFWLNYAIAVGVLHVGGGGSYVTIDMWYLKFPANNSVPGLAGAS